MSEDKATPRPYDDVLPVCLMGESLLDRHNDLLATFDGTVEIKDRERIVAAVNERQGLKEALEAVMGLVPCVDNPIYRQAQAALALAGEKETP